MKKRESETHTHKASRPKSMTYIDTAYLNKDENVH